MGQNRKPGISGRCIAGKVFFFQDGGVIMQVNSPNPDLKWQTDKQYNIGFDFSIFNNRISGTLELLQ